MSEKLFFYDLETTGLNHWQNGVHELAAYIIIDGEIKEKLNYQFKPRENITISLEALNVSGVKLADLNARTITEQQVITDLVNKLNSYLDRTNYNDKFQIAGYNIAAFDNNFLRAMLSHNAVNGYKNQYHQIFHSGSIDVMMLYSYFVIENRSEIGSFKLSEVCKRFGITIDEVALHSSDYDLFITYELFKRLRMEFYVNK